MWPKFFFLILFANLWILKPTYADRIDLVAIGKIFEKLNEKFGIIFKTIRNSDNSFQMFYGKDEKKFRKYAYESLHRFEGWRNLDDERTKRYFEIYDVHGTYLLPDAEHKRLMELIYIATKYNKESFNIYKKYLDDKFFSEIAGDWVNRHDVKKIDKKIQDTWRKCSEELSNKVQPLIREFVVLIRRNLPANNIQIYWEQMMGYGYHFKPVGFEDQWLTKARAAGESILSFLKGKVIRKLKLSESYVDHPIPAYVYSILRHQDLYCKVFPEKNLNDLLNQGIKFVKQLNMNEITETAENFFISLNFSNLGERFWVNSELITRLSGPESKISSLFKNKDDYRLNVNSTVSLQAYESMHRELFRLYRNIIMDKNNLEWTFRVSDFQPFDDALEESMIMVTKTITYALKIGILNNQDYTDEHLLNALIAEASSVFTELFSAVALKSWSYSALHNNITINQWIDRSKYENVLAIPRVCPTLEDSHSFIDCSSPEHGFPFQLNYLHSARTIMKYQIFGGLCAMAGQYSRLYPEEKLLHKCDISGNTEVGNFLQNTILSMGSKLTWRQKLKLITGTSQLDPTSMIDYFKPIFIHTRNLQKENVTWKENFRRLFLR